MTITTGATMISDSVKNTARLRHQSERLASISSEMVLVRRGR